MKLNEKYSLAKIRLLTEGEMKFFKNKILFKMYELNKIVINVGCNILFKLPNRSDQI